MDMILINVYFKEVPLISVTYVVGSHCNCLYEAIPMCTYYMCPSNKLAFFTICVFHKLLNYFVMFSVMSM